MIQLPQDPLSRFVAIYDALNAERGWWSDASCLRFSALTAITCPGTAPAVAMAIRGAAEEIHKKSGWFGPLSSNLRFVVSAMLVHQDEAAPLVAHGTGRFSHVRDPGRRRREPARDR